MTISAQTFDEHKRFLWGMCYRMTGSAADADDIVQDTFVRALEKPPADTKSPLRPWLIKVAMNLSRDQLRRRRRREYFGPWLPSPVPTDGDDGFEFDQPAAIDSSPVTRYDLVESVSMAFLLALEALTPAQRAVLILRDVFDYSTNETADALEMSEANIKVTLHRARRTMHSYDKSRVSNFSKRARELRETLQRFLSRLAAGDVQALKEMLAADVVLVSDGGGEVNALPEPVSGADRIVRLISKLYDANRHVTSTILRMVNGEPAILIDRSHVKPGHATFFTMHCELDGSFRIRRFNFVFAPSKLAAVKPPA
ncbi:MAG TPA: sigma-70 family RNA polymerase sigma factor [Pyrinomonadaceae bacterium]|nr:sigma-70 family RNA polymerase sigma factor [Pyrinomonadaceae bacterium]